MAWSDHIGVNNIEVTGDLDKPFWFIDGRQILNRICSMENHKSNDTRLWEQRNVKSYFYIADRKDPIEVMLIYTKMFRV